MILEQGETFIFPRLWYGALVVVVSRKGRPHLIDMYLKQGLYCNNEYWPVLFLFDSFYVSN